MIVELYFKNEKVYLGWYKPKEKMMHIVRDINEATIFPKKTALKYVEMLKKKNAAAIKLSNTTKICHKSSVSRETISNDNLIVKIIKSLKMAQNGKK